jgi:hypothetical protein
MSDLEKAIALLDALTPNDVAAMDARRRRQFGALCRRAANLAETADTAIKAGVLADLRQGQRQE